MSPLPLLSRLLLCLGLFAAVPVAALADMPPEGAPVPPSFQMSPPDGPGGMHRPFLQGLSLSDTQQDQLFDIEYQQMRTVRERLRTIRKAEEELHAMGLAANFDDARAKALVEASSKASAELALLRVRTEHRIYELLTPEQRKQLADMRDARPGRSAPAARDGQAACPPAPAGEGPSRH
jgi:periplasmic protein CpxP/Spy